MKSVELIILWVSCLLSVVLFTVGDGSRGGHSFQFGSSVGLYGLPYIGARNSNLLFSFDTKHCGYSTPSRTDNVSETSQSYAAISGA